jgi:hypothetical protein
MSKKVNKRSTTASQRMALSLWLREWNLDLVMREDSGSCTPPPAIRVVERYAVKVGDIRLLPPMPVSLSKTERPVYVLVLQEVDGFSFDVAPFSRFSVPATPQEWLTGLAQAPLRVLCLWNVQRMTAEALGVTWRVKMMPVPKVKTAAKIARSALLGQSPLSTRVGPSLVNPIDPRHIYIAEERQLIYETVHGLQTARDKKPLIYEIPEPDKSLRIAAERKHPWKQE